MEPNSIVIVVSAVAVAILVVTLSYFCFRGCWGGRSYDAFGSDLPIHVQLSCSGSPLPASQSSYVELPSEDQYYPVPQTDQPQPQPHQSVEEIIAEAMERFAAKDFPAVLELFQQAFDQDSNHGNLSGELDSAAYEALGEAQVEVGKLDSVSVTLSSEGVANIKRAIKRGEELKIDEDHAKVLELKLLHASKIESQHQLSVSRFLDQKALNKLEYFTSKLEKLQIIQKMPRAQKINGSYLFEQIKRVVNEQKQVVIADLRIPEHLVCQVSGELMLDPVIIESGQTYQRCIIKRHFEICEYQAERHKEACDEDEYDRASYFRCPLTQKMVDPNKIIKNRRIQLAVEDFLRKNPWAYDFNPKENFRKITVTH